MRYVVGDLCNCLSDDDWERYCNRDILPEGAYIFRTAYGDGTYVDKENRRYDVDSGTLGIIPLDKVTDETKLRESLKYRIINIIDMDESEVSEDTCYRDDNMLYLGDVIIDMDD
jgi:hypothetical protein